MTKKIYIFLPTLLFYFFYTNSVLADIKEEIINKFTATNTLSFNFKQKISDREEFGNCFIKYPLLMKCNYKNLKEKIIISDGKKVAIIKKKYKKIYAYPIKLTPLSFILEKKKILSLIRKKQPFETNISMVEFRYTDEKKNNIKIFFDKESLEFKGWETKDAYSNKVSFIINDLKVNNQIMDSFFKIPREEDL